ncbi:MAG: FAD-dependent oxidoreductase [Thermodesulfobacteriota bacterium]|nr:FAD-dependent oxidoreductase [Thermodesulfobacteriota bacterium]
MEVYRSTLSRKESPTQNTCDVVIVGAGIVGLATALRLAETFRNLTITVLAAKYWKPGFYEMARSFPPCSQAPPSTLFPSSSLGTQLCRSSSFDSHEAVPKRTRYKIHNKGPEHPYFVTSSIVAWIRSSPTKTTSGSRLAPISPLPLIPSHKGRGNRIWHQNIRSIYFLRYQILYSEAKLELPGQAVPKPRLGNEGK